MVDKRTKYKIMTFGKKKNIQTQQKDIIYFYFKNIK